MNSSLTAIGRFCTLSTRPESSRRDHQVGSCGRGTFTPGPRRCGAIAGPGSPPPLRSPRASPAADHRRRTRVRRSPRAEFCCRSVRSSTAFVIKFESWRHEGRRPRAGVCRRIRLFVVAGRSAGWPDLGSHGSHGSCRAASCGTAGQSTDPCRSDSPLPVARPQGRPRPHRLHSWWIDSGEVDARQVAVRALADGLQHRETTGPVSLCGQRHATGQQNQRDQQPLHPRSLRVCNRRRWSRPQKQETQTTFSQIDSYHASPTSGQSRGVW